jgi:site-specific DNA-methyltransferase (adenine-specific)
MKGMADKSVDWVITDPPYGIDIGSMNFTQNTKGGVAVRNDYRGISDWDKFTPDREYFDEIIRVSKNQIIFGGNYFTDKLPVSKSWIIWDKRTEDKYSNDFADCEMAWTSLTKPSRICRYLFSGMMQGNMGDKDKRVHPTQKPVTVMRWILEKYTKPGETILDPFMGAGSTGIACKQTHHPFTGIELDPHYFEVAKTRINTTQEMML